MGFRFFKVRLNQKRKVAIAELMAMGYDQNEAVEILDVHDINSAQFWDCSERPTSEVDVYEGVDEMGTY